MDWKEYENEIHQHFKSEFPNATILYNVKIEGKFSKIERQIDVLIEDYFLGNKMRIVIDAKYYSTKIDVKDVESFIGLLNDVEAHKGIMISNEGFSQAAINRAHYDITDLELDILNFKDLKQFQAFGAIPFSGKHGVILPAPFGWIIDGTKKQNVLATFYQRGLTLEKSAANKEWMYVNIISKDKNVLDLDSFLAIEEKEIKKDFPDCKIIYSQTVKRKDEKTLLREILINTYPTPEYTGFVEFSDFIFLCVLFSPTELFKKNIKKLEHVIGNVIPLEIEQS
ncbi:MAG: restriction endonuclease [Ignavibacteriales bacterium]|nr:restriction endonuclease [Ignavibacteriales bacterium]